MLLVYMNFKIFLLLLLKTHLSAHLLNTTSGHFVGRIVHYRNVTVQQYLGIQYGQIKKRFERAEPVHRKDNTTLFATKLGPVCKSISTICVPQRGTNLSLTFCSINYGILSTQSLASEQCLYLNLFIPINNKSEKKPVFMWIHGGSGQTGTGNLFDGTVLAALGDVIVVTFNFRLNLFGFLSSGDERLEGNLGLYDQSMVLDWIYDNSEALGADIQRITVGGHSAGAPHAYYLALSPYNRGRIRRLILQSGSPYHFWSHISRDEAMEKFNIVAEDNKCGFPRTFDEKLKCLSEKDFNLIFEHEHHSYTSANHTNVVANGYYMNQFKKYSNSNIQLSDVDMLIGANDDEGIYVSVIPLLIESYRNSSITLPNANFTDIALTFLNIMLPNKTCLYRKALKLYHMNNIPKNCSKLTECYCSYFYNYSRLISDILFYNDYYRFLEHRISHPSKTYVYQYSYQTSQDHPTLCTSFFKQRHMVGHFAELEYTWGIPLLFENGHYSNSHERLTDISHYENNENHSYTNEQIEFSIQLIEQWTNFIRYGQPNSTRYESQWKSINNLSNGFLMNLKLPKSQLRKLKIPFRVQFWMNKCIQTDNKTMFDAKNRGPTNNITLVLLIITCVFLKLFSLTETI